MEAGRSPSDDVSSDGDHDRGIRNEERLRANDDRWTAHDEWEAAAWKAHEHIHKKDADALALQLTETLRRLDELNHAHEQAREKERDFVPRETHEGAIRELNAAVATAQAFTATSLPREVFENFIKEQYRPDMVARDATLKSLQDWRNKATGATVILTLAAGVIGAAVMKALGG